MSPDAFVPEWAEPEAKKPEHKPVPVADRPVIIPNAEYSEEAEAAVLGSMIVDVATIPQVQAVLSEDDFWLNANRIAFRGITEVYSGGGFDLILLRDWLKKHKLLQEVGGVPYLKVLAESVASSANAGYYAQIVWDTSKDRKLRESVRQASSVVNSPASLSEKEVAVQRLALKAELTPPSASELVMLRASDVERKEIVWLMPNRIPAYTLNLFVGNGSAGKSWLTTSLVASFTTGTPWPDCKNSNPPGRVMLFNDEDDVERVIVPRLQDNGANLSLIDIYDTVRCEDGSKDIFDIQSRLVEFEKFVDKNPDCKLVIFDPITAYLGNCKENSNSEVRAALLGLQDLAQRREITVVGVNHLSKKTDATVAQRVLGSTAFVAASRSVWGVIYEKTEDGETPRWRKVLPIKCNYSINPTGLQFEIVNGQVVWDSAPLTEDIDQAMLGGRVSVISNEAEKFLKERLADNTTVLATELIEEAKEYGISKTTLGRVATKMGVTKRPSEMYGGKFVWNMIK